MQKDDKGRAKIRHILCFVQLHYISHVACVCTSGTRKSETVKTQRYDKVPSCFHFFVFSHFRMFVNNLRIRNRNAKTQKSGNTTMRKSENNNAKNRKHNNEKKSKYNNAKTQIRGEITTCKMCSIVALFLSYFRFFASKIQKSKNTKIRQSRVFAFFHENTWLKSATIDNIPKTSVKLTLHSL